MRLRPIGDGEEDACPHDEDARGAEALRAGEKRPEREVGDGRDHRMAAREAQIVDIDEMRNNVRPCARQ